MISSFTIGNFKAFGPAQHIPLRPITLIFGPNSAGKSSVLHSLLFAHEASRSGQLDIFKTQLGGESVDLGGFRQFTHCSRSENRITLTFQIPTLNSTDAKHLTKLKSHVSQTWNLEAVTVTATYGIRGAEEKTGLGVLLNEFASLLDVAKENEKGFDQAIQYRRMMDQLIARTAEAGDDPPALLSYEIAVAGQPVVRASRKGTGVKVDSIFLDHPALGAYLESLLLSLSLATEVTEESMALIRDVIGTLAKEMELEMGGLLPTTVKKEAGVEVPATQILLLKGAPPDAREQVRLFFSFNFAKLIESVNDQVSGFFARFKYLGPLRSNPPRHLAFAEDTANSSSEGTFAWKAVRDNAGLRAKVNEWFGKDFLQTKYELGVDNLISSVLTTDALETALDEVVSEKYQEWDEARERMGDSRADELYHNPYDAWDTKVVLKKLLFDVFRRTAAGAVGELTLRDKRNQAYVSHRDIGIGVSQVLPVLALAYSSKDDVIAIEQPEIHLHPALQSELADVFIESALGPQKNMFILETHSEHLILRLLRRVRDTSNGSISDGAPSVRPEDLSVLYVQPGKDGSEIIELPVTADGDFACPWPGGFFAERFADLP